MNINKIFITLLVVGLVGILGYFTLLKETPKLEVSKEVVEYTNTEYGFSFSLPLSWNKYSIVNSKWEGYTLGQGGNIPSEEGALISIRHSEWTKKNPRQDIPIMVFTIEQWNMLQQDKFHIGAAPIGPSEFGRNSKYVFALPARYNFAFPTGYEEVEKIIEGKPFKTF